MKICLPLQGPAFFSHDPGSDDPDCCKGGWVTECKHVEGLEKLPHCPAAPSGNSVKAPLSEPLVFSVTMGVSLTFSAFQGHPTLLRAKAMGTLTTD